MADLSTTKIFAASDNVAYTDLNAIIAQASINEAAISGRTAAATVNNADLFLVSSGPGTLKSALASVVKTYMSSVYPTAGATGLGGPYTVTNAMATIGSSISVNSIAGKRVAMIFQFTTYTIAGGATLLQYQVMRVSDSAIMGADLTGITITTNSTFQAVMAFDGLTLAGASNSYVLQAKTDVGTVLIRNLNSLALIFT